MDAMKYLNKKDVNGEYILSDEKIHKFIDSMCQKYPLRTSVYPGDRVNELKRNEDCIEYTINRYISNDAPIRTIENSCFMDDTAFHSQYLYEEDVVNATKDFWAFMVGVFGNEYQEDLKQHLIETRDDYIREATEEITEEYKKYADIVDSLCGEEELENC